MAADEEQINKSGNEQTRVMTAEDEVEASRGLENA